MEVTRYRELAAEVLAKAPADQVEAVCGQPTCEYEIGPDPFLGFLQVYDAARLVVPRSRVIVDLGCYCAAQAWLFDEWAGYIGVDVCGLARFAPPNAVHRVATIQDFCAAWDGGDGAFAIVSYVPDEGAVEAARRTFPDLLSYYPERLSR